MGNDNKTLELQIRIAAQEAVMAVSSLKGEVQALAAAANKFAEADGAALEKSFKDAQSAAKESASSINDIKKAIGSLAEVAALTKALSVIKDMGAFALQTADNFQTMKNQFGILLGDMEAGAGLFNEIKAFNDKTPFDMGTLTQATNVLVAAKVPLQDLQAQLTKFGDLAQGNSQRMTSYVNAFSQAAAKGKADMQVLNTYIHQGVPILDELAKNFGVATAEILEMSSQGQISFADFSKALDGLTAAGGRYFGGMELSSKSLSAMQEGLKEAVNSLAASFGDMLLPAAIAVVGALTRITNAINNSPIAKSIFAAALVFLTGCLAAMAVKALVAFAAQMSLNFAIGALNWAVLAATIAVAGLAAGYTFYAAETQKAARGAENMAYQQRQQKDAIDSTTQSIEAFAAAVRTMSDEKVDYNVDMLLNKVWAFTEIVEEGEKLRAEAYANSDRELARYWTKQINDAKKYAAQFSASFNVVWKEYFERREGFIDSLFGGTQEGKIERLKDQLARAKKYLSDLDLDDRERAKLQSIIQSISAELEKLTKTGTSEVDRMAAAWKKSWGDFMEKTRAEQSNDPFAMVEYERKKKLQDAWDNYVRTDNKATTDEINRYYDEKRREVIEKLANEESKMMRELSATKIDDLEYEKKEALRMIRELEEKRVIAAAGSEAEIAAIRKRFADMRKTVEVDFEIKIEKTKLEEARADVKDWQQEISDGAMRALMGIEGFSAQAAAVLGDLAAKLANLSITAAISGFEEFGRALGEGKKGTEALEQALASMAKQILNQLPMMFLQAGLQLIANGQWPLGLGFIAAAGSSAIVSGYVDGAAQKEASRHAQGGVFDEYGQAARAFAAGGAFTNQIVGKPTYFAHGGGLGLMGEAGPEAVMPLARMPNGDLGVRTAGGGASVVVNVINNSGAEVRREESETADGGRQVDIVIGDMINRHITSGKADRAMGRYGLRAAGV